MVLDVRVGKFLDTSLIDVDVQPGVVRCLIKGLLLQLVLPEVRTAGLPQCSRQRVHSPHAHACLQEVMPDYADCQRSKTTGALVVTMPKVNSSSSSGPAADHRPFVTSAKGRVASTRASGRQGGPKAATGAAADISAVSATRRAVVVASAGGADDDDEPPPPL